MNTNISYTGVILDDKSRDMLKIQYSHLIDGGWTWRGHHMTICLGPLRDPFDVGKEVTLTATHIGFSPKAAALRVEGFQSLKLVPHITLVVNEKQGGKPRDSDFIENWAKIEPFELTGIVQQMENGVL